MPHLTCVGHTRADLVDLLGSYRAAGIENVLALAGDPPADGSPMTGDFTYATELVELVHEVNGFAVGVAAFPELHPRSPDRATDRQRLAEKLALADFGMTQFFFEVEHYKRMVDELADLGCEVPVIPGVMPFVSVPGTRRMAGINNTEIPDWLNERLDAVDGDAEATRQLGVEVATDLVAELLDHGVPGVHLYAMNRARASRRSTASSACWADRLVAAGGLRLAWVDSDVPSRPSSDAERARTVGARPSPDHRDRW